MTTIPHEGEYRESGMQVRFFPGSKQQKTTLIAGFLSEHNVDHEMMGPDDLPARLTFRLGENPAIEVNGRLFVDPNLDALKKILHIN
jgi:hypothetical protein